MKLCTAAQMRNLEEIAIKQYGIPGIVLMENAGRATVEAMVRRFGNPRDKVCAILVGPGNNGGDGLVIARHLHQLGGRPEVFLLVPGNKIKGDAATNLKIVRKLPIPIHRLCSTKDLAKAEGRFNAANLLVDSIFGTGLAREIGSPYLEVIARINRLACPKIAVDIPSGLHADSGRLLGECVQADLTVTFGLAKTGLVTGQSRRFVGVLETADIGIPPAAVAEAAIRVELLDQQVGLWLPRRFSTAHKGTYGHLLVVAGSCGKTGAALLCGQGGLRAGTGLVTMAVPRDLNAIFEITLLEAMTVALPSAAGCLSIDDYQDLLLAANGKQAMVLGPGLGQAPETGELIKKVYREIPLPMVVDADALNILAQEPAMLRKPAGPRILTPHPGEMARLTGLTMRDIQDARIQKAGKFAMANQVYLVLKGSGTVIAAPDGRIAVNPTGNPGMAAGGMGDVLAGVIGGFLAQGLTPWQAAGLGVYSHGLAGDRLAETTPAGYLASELAAELPVILHELVAD